MTFGSVLMAYTIDLPKLDSNAHVSDLSSNHALNSVITGLMVVCLNAYLSSTDNDFDSLSIW